jgi:hypothetical protein
MEIAPLVTEGPPATPAVTAWDHALAALALIEGVETLEEWPTPDPPHAAVKAYRQSVMFTPHGVRATPELEIGGACVAALVGILRALDQAGPIETQVAPRKRYGDACNALLSVGGFYIAVSGRTTSRGYYVVDFEALFKPALTFADLHPAKAF